MRRTVIFIISFLIVTGFCIPKVFADQEGNSDSFLNAQNWVIEASYKLKQDPVKFLEDSGWLAVNDQEEISTNATIDFIQKLQDRWPILHNNKLDMVALQICENALSSGLDTGRILLKDVSLSPEYKALKTEIATTAIIMQDYIEPARAAQILFFNLIDAMYSNLMDSGNTTLLLDNDYVEFGVSFCGGAATLKPGTVANAYLLTLVYTRPAGPQPEWIQCGHVYFDKNGNKEYDEGEGLANVKISSDPEDITTQTDRNGRYCFRRPRGIWILYLQDYPFMQDFTTYSKLLEVGKNNGILYYDYPLLLTQEMVDYLNSLSQN